MARDIYVTGRVALRLLKTLFNEIASDVLRRYGVDGFELQGELAMASDAHSQAELISKAASSRKDRAAFLAEPRKYAEEHGVELDAELIKLVRNEMEDIERAAALLGMPNRYIEEYGTKIEGIRLVELGSSPVQLAAWPMVAYYAVTAASAVVSAVSATYMATKWLSSARLPNVTRGR